MDKPKFFDDDAFRSLRGGQVETFNALIAERNTVDYSDADFRGTDFRGADLSKVLLRGAYLKDADLRGCDLRQMDLEGCSLHNAKIGGAYFPESLVAAEIDLSVRQGTRVRMRRV